MISQTKVSKNLGSVILMGCNFDNLFFQVRTKDRTFESVSHLINHHRDTGRPIISADSALRLVTPVRSSRKI